MSKREHVWVVYRRDEISEWSVERVFFDTKFCSAHKAAKNFIIETKKSKMYWALENMGYQTKIKRGSLIHAYPEAKK